MERRNGPRGTYYGIVIGIAVLGFALVLGFSLSSVLAASGNVGSLRDAATQYSVTFTESGLASGTSWSVILDGTSQSSTSTSIVFSEPDGTYEFTVGSVPGYTVAPEGNVTVEGAPVSVPITFVSTVPYTITFTETGLPSGTSWSVTLDGTTQSSTTSAIAFSEPTGSYGFTVGSVSGYVANPSTGTVTVNGAPASETIAFAPAVPYAVTFSETGLPSGTTWSVTLNDATRSSTTSSIIFSEPDGLYAFAIGAVPGYTTGPEGNVTVNGGPVDVPITFTPTVSEYTVTFTETGLPSGTIWSVTFGGIAQTSSNGSYPINFVEPNGTYGFTVGSVSGYVASPNAGSVPVHGAPVTETITFTVTSSGGAAGAPAQASANSGDPMGLPILAWAALGAAAVVAGIGVALVLRHRTK